MTREQARAFISARITELPKAKKRVGGYYTYICPFCNNGSGKDGDGISTKDGKHYKCFKCGYSGDYLDILKKQQNVDNEQYIFSLYGLKIETTVVKNKKTSQLIGVAPTIQPETKQTEPQDLTNTILQANKTLQASSEALAYLRSRGISPETANRFKVGYVSDWKSPTAMKNGKNPAPTPRLIFPTSKTGYTARSINCKTPEKYRFIKEGETGYFGKKALYGTFPVFIVEGAIDALSICEVGGEACALGGTSGVDKFLAMLDKEPPTVSLILSLDTDTAGKEAQIKLKLGLEERKISFYEANTSGEYKDPNEHLQRNRKAFTAFVSSESVEFDKQEAIAEKEKYVATATCSYINAFIANIVESADTSVIKTGFNEFDNALNGGLHEGLYILGALSSLGKTTFILQTADQIACDGYDVLIFSLEMSRYELIAKSISRLTFINCCGNPNNAKSTREILSGTKRKYNTTETSLINQSIITYCEYSRFIYIHEGIGNIGVEQIKHEVQKHISFTGRLPVVIIDYLQILAPYDMRATDKQNTDKAVLELKRLSRDKKIPIIAISSFNRDNYLSPVNMASFKESGAIEYSSDVLLGLQLAGMDLLNVSDTKKAESLKKIEDWKKANPRKAQLKILKNRNGETGLSLYYDYYPVFNHFDEQKNEPE